MTDWKEWFELWTLHTPDTRLKLVKNATFLEQLYDNFKARMIAEQKEENMECFERWNTRATIKPSDATDKNVVSMSEPIENNKITTAKFNRNAALGYLIYAEQSMKSGKNPVGPEPWILETIRAALLAQIDAE